MTPQVHDKLKSTTARYETLLALVGEAAVQADPPTFRKHTIEMAELEPLVEGYRRHTQLSGELADAREMASSGDAEMKALADDEIARLEPQIEAIEEELKALLVPKDPNDNRNVVLEIRAGTGGDEAALFAGELFRMYSRYAERRGGSGRDELSDTGVGGVKEVIATIEGKLVYRQLKHESGVHRVQRVPRRKRAAASTRPPRPWPCCRKPRKSTCRSIRKTCASTRSARADRAARA
jgi:peptide chain release factor 1